MRSNIWLFRSRFIQHLLPQCPRLMRNKGCTFHFLSKKFGNHHSNIKDDSAEFCLLKRETAMNFT